MLSIVNTTDRNEKVIVWVGWVREILPFVSTKASQQVTMVLDGILGYIGRIYDELSSRVDIGFFGGNDTSGNFFIRILREAAQLNQPTLPDWLNFITLGASKRLSGARINKENIFGSRSQPANTLRALEVLAQVELGLILERRGGLIFEGGDHRATIRPRYPDYRAGIVGGLGQVDRDSRIFFNLGDDDTYTAEQIEFSRNVTNYVHGSTTNWEVVEDQQIFESRDVTIPPTGAPYLVTYNLFDAQGNRGRYVNGTLHDDVQYVSRWEIPDIPQEQINEYQMQFIHGSTYFFISMVNNTDIPVLFPLPVIRGTVNVSGGELLV